MLAKPILDMLNYVERLYESWGSFFAMFLTGLSVTISPRTSSSYPAKAHAGAGPGGIW